MLTKLRQLPGFLKVFISILVFFILFLIINKIIIGELTDPVKEAKAEQGVMMVALAIASFFYTLICRKPSR
jgi:hypothetical protein